jgi:hypothetical protein
MRRDLMPAIVSFSGDQRGESALTHLPARHAERQELLIQASGLAKADTYTAVVTRALIEFYARRGQQTVTFCPPADPPTWGLLATLIGCDLPRHFTLTDDAPKPPTARAAMIPVQPIASIEVADLLTRGLRQEIGETYGKRNIAILEGAFGTLVENGIEHAPDSPVGVLAAIGHEREAHVLQLVVCDLGAGLGAAADPEEAMIELVERSQSRPAAGLAGMVADARRKEIDLELRIASGASRLSWRHGVADVRADQAVPGFTAAAIIHLDP